MAFLLYGPEGVMQGLTARTIPVRHFYPLLFLACL